MHRLTTLDLSLRQVYSVRLSIARLTPNCDGYTIELDLEEQFGGVGSSGRRRTLRAGPVAGLLVDGRHRRGRRLVHRLVASAQVRRLGGAALDPNVAD